MEGTYDRIYSHMNSSSESFQAAQKRILRLVKYKAEINKLNIKYLYRTNNFSRNASIAVRQTLCPKCPEDQELCEHDRDKRRRYHCKTLSRTMGENVKLYLPSQNDLPARKERIKRELKNTAARNPGITQNQLLNRVRGDRRLVRDCLKELTNCGLLRCSEQVERNQTVKRYSIVYD